MAAYRLDRMAHRLSRVGEARSLLANVTPIIIDVAGRHVPERSGFRRIAGGQPTIARQTSEAVCQRLTAFRSVVDTHLLRLYITERLITQVVYEPFG